MVRESGMRPLRIPMSGRGERLKWRAKIADVIPDPEDAFDSCSELEPETATLLIEELNRRREHAAT